MTNKNNKVLTVIAIIFLLVMVIGATYAFFEAEGGETTSDDAIVTSNTTDLLTFSIDKDISFTVAQDDFTSGGQNKSGDATATATLTPNNKTGAATMNYYMYLNITDNPTVYSSTNTNEDPELMLQVFDGNNQLVTLTGLGTQKTIKGVTGYDITGVTGLKTLLDNHAISATNNQATIENWRVVVTLINLDVDQFDNTGKEISAELIIRKDEMVEPGTDIIGELAAKYNLPEPANITLQNGSIYYHDENLINGVGDNSYRYSGPNPDNYICFGDGATTTGTCSAGNLYRIIGLIPVDVVVDSTTTPVTTEKQTLYKIIKHDYLTSSDVSVGIATYDDCYGEATGGCVYKGPSGNQYMPLPQGYYWSGAFENRFSDWGRSTFNTLGLNGTGTGSYLNSIGSSWADKIANVIWKVGGAEHDKSYYITSYTPLSIVYNKEIINSGSNAYYGQTSIPVNYAAKVGLIYLSDYGYATVQSDWNTALTNFNYNNDVGTRDWLCRGVQEWTITRVSYDVQDDVFEILGSCNVGSEDSIGYWGQYDDVPAARPVMYLKQGTKIDFTHAGTSADPYRIS